jgi:hypothetical protein
MASDFTVAWRYYQKEQLFFSLRIKLHAWVIQFVIIGCRDTTDFTIPSVAGFGVGVTTRGSLLRRQSSAFEFSRPESEIAKCMTVGRFGRQTQGIRRQSSAFEIAAVSARYGLPQTAIVENTCNIIAASIDVFNASTKQWLETPLSVYSQCCKLTLKGR